MILLEIIFEFIESLTSATTTTCTTNPQTMSDIADCAKAHEEILKGNFKNVTPFVKYVEQVNEENGRKTVAGQVYIPLSDTIRACVTSNDKPKK